MSDENQKSCFGNFEKMACCDKIFLIMNKKTITILIGITILAGALAFIVGKKSKEVAPAKEIKTEVTEKIEGWQTYRNEELGFEVQYPEGWFVKDYQKNNPKSSPSIGFDSWKNNPDGSIWRINRYNRTVDSDEDQIENLIMQYIRNYDESAIKRNDITFNTYSATEVIIESDRGVIGISVYITYKQYIYVVHVEDYSNVNPEEMSWPYDERYGLLKQLGNEYPETFLNSFRFID
ncbi:hypothetical protein KKG48_01695 [Patescibacteria group bacterium]|nr:hypothetical protein [Patescibacteria group bacterium]